MALVFTIFTSFSLTGSPSKLGFSGYFFQESGFLPPVMSGNTADKGRKGSNHGHQ